MQIDPEKVGQYYTRGGLWQAEQTPQVGGALALRSSLQETPKEQTVVSQTSFNMEGKEKEANTPDWQVVGLISEGPYIQGLSLVTTR